MDIQKEREAFEKHASKFFTTNEAFENDGENYVYDEVKFMWDCWLAAKAQAVPEGFVLVSAEQMKQLVESHELVKSRGGLDAAKHELILLQKHLNNTFGYVTIITSEKIENLKQAIADVESCMEMSSESN